MKVTDIKTFAVDCFRTNWVFVKVYTDRWEKNPDFYANVPSRFTPLGDVAVGEDIADAVWYFAAHARNTTGAELVVDGGNSTQLYPVIPEK